MLPQVANLREQLILVRTKKLASTQFAIFFGYELQARTNVETIGFLQIVIKNKIGFLQTLLKITIGFLRND